MPFLPKRGRASLSVYACRGRIISFPMFSAGPLPLLPLDILYPDICMLTCAPANAATDCTASQSEHNAGCRCTSPAHSIARRDTGHSGAEGLCSCHTPRTDASCAGAALGARAPRRLSAGPRRPSAGPEWRVIRKGRKHTLPPPKQVLSREGALRKEGLKSSSKSSPAPSRATMRRMGSSHCRAAAE